MAGQTRISSQKVPQGHLLLLLLFGRYREDTVSIFGQQHKATIDEPMIATKSENTTRYDS